MTWRVKLNDQAEWYKLQTQIHNNDLVLNNYNNQFFHRLLIVLADPNAHDLDKLLAYKDALRSVPKDIDHPELSISTTVEVSDELLKISDLTVTFHKKIKLVDNRSFGEIDLSSVYYLEQRRVINKLKIDPALKKN